MTSAKTTDELVLVSFFCVNILNVSSAIWSQRLKYNLC